MNDPMNSEYGLTLTQPLVVFSHLKGQTVGMIPAGATLTFRDALPEGVERFEVIINVEGQRLATERRAPQVGIAPLTSLPSDVPPELRRRISLDDLGSLLESVGVTRPDLEELLERGF